MSERHHPVIDERTYRRRRLAVLAVPLALVLAAAPFVGSGETGGRVEVAAGDDVVRAAALGTPTDVRELLSETTTTLVEATGATTAPAASVTTEAPPTTEAPAAPVEDEVDDADDVDEVEAASQPAPPTTEAPPPTSPPTTAAPTTTAAPAPTTTRAPTTTTTTTAPAATGQRSGGYAYDDPRSTQVWYDLAGCESGGRWSIDTGNGYYGGLQFSLGAWESVGGTGYPHEHPAEVQIDMGRRLQARQGWGAWPHCSEKLGLR
ncbi:MAG: transglycosylase family protein [Acidimicrobiia bacterium]